LIRTTQMCKNRDLESRETPFTLYGEVGRYYIWLAYPKLDEATKVKDEYKMVIHRLDSECYDYTSYYGDMCINTKYNCTTDFLKEEVDAGHLREEPWLGGQA
jgi:hypothetical protein